MIYFFTCLSALIMFVINPTNCLATDVQHNEAQVTTINLHYISSVDVVSVLESLIDKSVSISTKDNSLIIKGSADKTKNILPIIEKIDSPAEAFTIEFIAANRKVNFKQDQNTYNAGINLNKTSQSISIIERQWVKLNTGLTIPITERRRLADGTETQSFRYKKISKSYLFKVHEFSGWSVVQVGVNAEYLSDDIAGAIEHTKLDTTIIGKTGEWIEVASRKPIDNDQNSTVYSSQLKQTNHIFLYIKVIKSEKQIETDTNK